MSATLPEGAKALLDAKTFVTVATVEPDGQPQLSVLWVTRDGDDVILSTTLERRKAKNIAANNKVTVLAHGAENPYSYLEVRGTATLTVEGGRELINDLHEKYQGSRPYPNDGPGDT